MQSTARRSIVKDSPAMLQQGKASYAGNAPSGGSVENKSSTGQLSVKNFTISMSAAGLSHIVHHPLYTLKSHMMMHGRQFKFSIFLKNVLSGHARFLYRGLIPRTLGVMPEKGMKMQAFYLSESYMERNGWKPGLVSWLAAGSMGGLATTVIGCPSERIMVIAQIRKQGVFDVIRQTGLKGLYKGVMVTFYRDISFNAVFFTVTELTAQQWSNRTGVKCNGWERFLAGLGAGVLASVVACPLDVVKTRVQGQKLGEARQSTISVLKSIIQNEGPRYLFKGLLPRLIAVPSMMSFFYMLNNKFNEIFINL